MSRNFAVVIGLVTDVVDPDQQGRVKVTFPWLSSDTVDGGWAPVVRPMAGKERGFFYVPEVDDEVLVAFEQGDVDHPMVLGFLHNGVDKPPQKGIDERVRRLESVSGQQFELDDRAGEESIRLTTSKGHQLELHDADDRIELNTRGGHRVRLTDSPGKVVVSSPNGTELSLEDDKCELKVGPGGSGVTVTIDNLSMSTSSMTSTDVTGGTSVTISAGTQVKLVAPSVSVNAAMTQFSGIVQCSALMTQSVVSQSYTPGVGNIW
jgi:uncharacterized protein involved in type VI secretion and phage assembly